MGLNPVIWELGAFCLLSIGVNWSLVFAFAPLHPLELLQPNLVKLLKFSECIDISRVLIFDGPFPI